MRIRIRPQQLFECADPDGAYPPLASGIQAAAVMMMIQERNGESVFVMIRRSQNLRHHRGEIAFAGGRRESFDRKPVDTALREVWEELSVPADVLSIAGTLPETQTLATGYAITPVLALLQKDFTGFVPDDREVDDILFVPIGLFHTKPVYLGPQYFFLSGFHFGTQVIWGATAAIVRQFVRHCSARHPGAFESFP